jgi:tetratricopeptide (TPR) repeat protein
VGLANHYYLAQDYERAFHYFCMAGDRATRLYESREAILHYTMAINLIEQCSPDSNYIAKLIRGRGLAYDRLGDFKKASVDYRQTLQLAINADDQKTAWQANIDLGKLWTSRDYNQARMYYETALEISRSLDQPGLIASSLNWMGNWHANNENPLEGVKNHQEALHLLEELGDNRALANTLDLLALANMLVGDLHATVEYYDRAIPLFRDLEDQPRLASSLIGRASTTVSLIWLTAVFTNTPKEAIINVQEGLSIAGEIGLTSEEAWGNYSMGLLNLIQGDFGRAQEYIESGLMVASEVSHREYEVGSRFAYAAFYMTLLSPWQALDHIKVAMKQAEELCSPTWINLTAGAMTAVYLMLGDNSEAEACLDRVKLVEKPMNTLGRRYCWVQLARLALSKDDPALALDIADRLIESIPGVSPEGVVTSLLMIRGNALAALGQATEAEQAYQAAINNIETTGERYVLWRIRGDLYQLYQAIGCQEAAEAELSLASVQIEELATSIPDENLTDGFRQGAYKTLKMDIPPILSKRSGKL